VTLTTITGDLTLGHMLAATGLDLGQVVILRHTYNVGGLETPTDLTPEEILDYTRKQGISNKLGRPPLLHWLCFTADGARRSRYLVAYENHGEVEAERTNDHRFFDLRPSDLRCCRP
jgi:hypothetical protein